MLALKLTTIGKSAGLIFPKEGLSRLKVQKGDTLFLTETKEGYLLTPDTIPSLQRRCNRPRM
jgi:hypothetical protein